MTEPNDGYDSLNPRSDIDDIIIPFKNLINEQYLRDFSVKIRSNLGVKRKKGEFVSPFAPYGYTRLESDKHRLVIDNHAAVIVRDIFRLKLEGFSGQHIAEYLNDIGEPSPSEYKKLQGINYKAAFQTRITALWSAAAIGRILRNPVYIGTLVQGKATTPSYKVKTRINLPEKDWCVIENAHDAIISRSDFEAVNALLLQDTRTAPGRDSVYPLSGMLFCGECGNNIVRKKTGRYVYYICASRKNGVCSLPLLRQASLESVLTEVVSAQITYLSDFEKCVDSLLENSHKYSAAGKLAAQITMRETELSDCEKYKLGLYEDYKNGSLTKGDYISFGNAYSERIDELKLSIKKLKTAQSGIKPTLRSLEYYKSRCVITKLSREFTSNIFERVDVYSNGHIMISFRFCDTFKNLADISDCGHSEAGCL